MCPEKEDIFYEKPVVIEGSCKVFHTFYFFEKDERRIKDLYFSFFSISGSEKQKWELDDIGVYFREKDGLMIHLGVIYQKDRLSFNEVLRQIHSLYLSVDPEDQEEKERLARWSPWFQKQASSAGLTLEGVGVSGIEKIVRAQQSKENIEKGLSPSAQRAKKAPKSQPKM